MEDTSGNAHTAFMKRLLVFLGYPEWGLAIGRRCEVAFRVGPNGALKWYKGTLTNTVANHVTISFDDGEVSIFPHAEMQQMMDDGEVRPVRQ